MKLRYARSAARQIDDVLGSLAEASPQGAASVPRRLLAVLDVLLLYPQAGRATSRGGVRRMMVAPFPYLLDDRVTDEGSVILRLRYAARKPAP